jgi:DNA-binding CsgD family transcriptional regulator
VVSEGSVTMPVTLQNKEELTRVLRSLGVDVHDLLMRIPGHVLILDRKQRAVAELGREAFGAPAGPVHEEASRRALQGEDVTYQWDLQKGRRQLQLWTTIQPLRNTSSRIVGLLVVTRNLGGPAEGVRAGGPATQQARQLLELERGVRQLTEVIESYRKPGLAYQLSSREQDVLHLLREGYRPRSIAEILRVSPLTVRNHLKTIFKKTGTHSQEELITMSRRPTDG